jgi:xanthine dehydrogenase accessory factor
LNPFLQQLVGLLAQGESFALATVLTQNGSAPRGAGAQMIVQRRKPVIGTVGGGQVEAKTIRMAEEVLDNHLPQVREFHYTGKDAAASDMICGGRQEILVEYLDAGRPDVLALFQQAQTAMQQRQKAWWVSQLPGPKTTSALLPRWLVTANGQQMALQGLPSLQFNQAGSGKPFLKLEEQEIKLNSVRGSQIIQTGQQRWLVAALDMSGSVYIFGAGHVSQKLAVLTSSVEFRTVVLDDRSEFANRARFPQADQIVVLNSYDGVFDWLPVDPDSAIVIVTRGHLHDKMVLRRALRTPAGYIGMIGSKRKNLLLFQELKNEGVSEETLKRVHAPIGLPIEAETPEEIAVSITAELIQARAKMVSHE